MSRDAVAKRPSPRRGRARLTCVAGFALGALALTGCETTTNLTGDAPARAVSRLDDVDHYELLALEPSARSSTMPANAAADFHGHRVVASRAIDDAALRARITDAIRRASGDADGLALGCYIRPRHGIRVVDAGVTSDLVICFSCPQVYVYEGATRIDTFFISRGPQALLDELLRTPDAPPAD